MLEVPLIFSSGFKYHFDAGKIFLHRTFPFLSTREPLNHTHRVHERVLQTKLHLPKELQSVNVTKQKSHCGVQRGRFDRNKIPEQNTRKAPMKITHTQACIWF